MNYYTVSPPPQEKKGILARLRKSAALRGKNGFGYRFLRDAVAGVHKENTPAARYLLKTSLFRYFIGFAATERFSPSLRGMNTVGSDFIIWRMSAI